MNIQPINKNFGVLQQSTTGGVIPPTFKCHKGTKERLRDFGVIIQESGIFKGQKFDIYSAYDKDGEIIHKLYYVSDEFGNWIKSKLKFFKEGKCYKTIRSKNDRQM